MDKKTIILVIIFSALVGVTIFFISRLYQNQSSFAGNSSLSKILSTPSPTPKPTLPPVDANTNLQEEIGKLTPPDFSSDYEKLKQQAN